MIKNGLILLLFISLCLQAKQFMVFDATTGKAIGASSPLNQTPSKREIHRRLPYAVKNKHIIIIYSEKVIPNYLTKDCGMMDYCLKSEYLSTCKERIKEARRKDPFETFTPFPEIGSAVTFDRDFSILFCYK